MILLLVLLSKDLTLELALRVFLQLSSSSGRSLHSIKVRYESSIGESLILDSR
jgi:hypothetical protein